MNLQIDRFPVSIISTSRSGSSALCNLVSKKFNLRSYQHPRYNKSLNLSDLIIGLESDSNWVLKIHADELIKYYPVLIPKVEKSFVIRLRRKDTLNQILSHYCAMVTDVWHYTKPIDTYKVTIDVAQIKKSIFAITYENNFVNDFPYYVDLDLWYEDLDLSDSELVQSPRPENYSQILKLIKIMLTKQGV